MIHARVAQFIIAACPNGGLYRAGPNNELRALGVIHYRGFVLVTDAVLELPWLYFNLQLRHLLETSLHLRTCSIHEWSFT